MRDVRRREQPSGVCGIFECVIGLVVYPVRIDSKITLQCRMHCLRFDAITGDEHRQVRLMGDEGAIAQAFEQHGTCRRACIFRRHGAWSATTQDDNRLRRVRELQVDRRILFRQTRQSIRNGWYGEQP